MTPLTAVTTDTFCGDGAAAQVSPAVMAPLIATAPATKKPMLNPRRRENVTERI
jgi:hypothetical protein